RRGATPSLRSPPRNRGGSREVPDGLRPRARVGGGPHGRASVHSRAAGSNRRTRGRDRTARTARGTGHLPAGGGGTAEAAPAAQRVVSGDGRGGPYDKRRTRRRRRRLGRGYHLRAHPRDRGR